MPVRIRTDIGVEQRGSSPRGVRILAGFVLIAIVAALLWTQRGFAEFALLGNFWEETAGTVVKAADSSVPTIEFTTPDGATHSFSENYWILCGRRSLCFRRNFTVGEQVPVLYDPKSPRTALVHDWALTATIISLFIEAGVGILLVLMMIVLIRKKPISASIEFSSAEPPQES
jgi:hypothetical protein